MSDTTTCLIVEKFIKKLTQIWAGEQGEGLYVVKTAFLLPVGWEVNGKPIKRRYEYPMDEGDYIFDNNAATEILGDLEDTRKYFFQDEEILSLLPQTEE